MTIEEGVCVQIMHLGAFDDEPATVALMDAYLEQNDKEIRYDENNICRIQS